MDGSVSAVLARFDAAAFFLSTEGVCLWARRLTRDSRFLLAVLPDTLRVAHLMRLLGVERSLSSPPSRAPIAMAYPQGEARAA
jgi:hypothetical protein